MPKQEKDFPAGAKRDEFNAQLKDEHAEEAADLNDKLDAIDPSKLDVKNVDNEIARWVSTAQGNIPVSNPHSDYEFIWVTVPDDYRESGARANIRQMEGQLRSRGYFPWQDQFDKSDKLKERTGWEHRGEGHAVGSSLRVLADVCLFAIRKEKHEENMELDRKKRLRSMGIITDPNEIPRQLRGRVFDLNDPRMAQVYGADRMKPVTFSAGFAQPNGGK